jgi:hypothetical protein
MLRQYFYELVACSDKLRDHAYRHAVRNTQDVYDLADRVAAVARGLDDHLGSKAPQPQPAAWRFRERFDGGPWHAWIICSNKPAVFLSAVGSRGRIEWEIQALFAEASASQTVARLSPN